MIIKTIELKNFRSYSEAVFKLTEKTNIFYGENAQGKTNVLEAVYSCAFGRSFRTTKDSDMVKFGEDFGSINIVYENDTGEKEINFVISIKNKKQIKINGIKQTKISDVLGKINIVLFSPEDMAFIKGEPIARRRYIDMLISQIKPGYLFNLQQYYRVLEQKNNMLKQKERVFDEKEADVWDEKLSEYDKKIKEEREKYIKELLPSFTEYHNEISDKKEKAELKYKTQISGDEKEIFNKIKEKREIDRRRGFTSVGIHRDDYVVTIDEKNLDVFGSQGQIRTAVLSLKLAEKDLIIAKKEEKPILLLDDVMSELDEKRRNYLSGKLNDCQVLITCTDKVKEKDVKQFKIEKKESHESRDTSAISPKE